VLCLQAAARIGRHPVNNSGGGGRRFS